MLRTLTKLAKRLLSHTPFELQRRLPLPTLDAVRLLLAFYSVGRSTRTVVQVGAADGAVNDPISEFLASPNLRAVLVEPIPSMFAKLSARYASYPNVTLVQAAIAEADGTARMFRPKPDPLWADSDIIPYLSSFDRKHIQSFGIASKDIEEVSVPALSLASLISRHNLPQVDLLQVDAEGYDAEIVKMALQLAEPPLCINFERVNLSIRAMNELFGLLESHRYRLLHDAWNSLAIHEHAERDLSNEVSHPKGSGS